MGSLNKVMIIGYLGQDPDTRYMDSGDACTTISVATTAKWKDKASGEQKEQTEWHRCVCFGKRAETMSEYLRKGSQVYVEGELRTRKWDDKDGITRYSTEIRVFQFSFLDRKGESDRPLHPAGQQNSTAPPAGAQEPTTAKTPSATQGPTGDPEDPYEYDEEIPF